MTTFKPPPLPGSAITGKLGTKKRKIVSQAQKPVLEAAIEKPVSKYAKERGMVCVKFGGGSIGQRSLPDRLLIVRGFTFYIEFKRPGGRATPAQKLKHQAFRDAGATVYVVDSVLDGKTIVDYHLMGMRDHCPSHPRSLPVYD